MKINPFQNFNKINTPKESDFTVLLSRLPVSSAGYLNKFNQVTLSEGRFYAANPMDSVRRSPIYNWLLAGGVSMAGALAAVMLFLNSNTPASTPRPTIVVAHTDIHQSQKVAATIDEALATVSSVEGVSDSNKF